MGVRRPDEAWLARRREPVLDPAQPICDAHHHLWDRPIPGGRSFRYFLEDFAQDASAGHNVRASVLVEAGARLRPGLCAGAMYRASGPEMLRSLGETEFYNGSAAIARSGDYGPVDLCAGIVAYVDLRLGDAVAEVLDRHCAMTRVRGIRNLTFWHAAPELNFVDLETRPGMLMEPQFRQGFRHLAARNLVYDATALGPQIEEVSELARAFPETRIVLDHLGGILGAGPYKGRRDVAFREWRSALLLLATQPNTFVKIGGMSADRGGFGLAHRQMPSSSQELAELWRPYFETVIELFGPARCMFESNFPVEKSAVGYVVLWNAFKRLAVGLSQAERNSLFFETALRVYDLDISDRAAFC